jgi:hypothetical protein
VWIVSSNSRIISLPSIDQELFSNYYIAQQYQGGNGTFLSEYKLLFVFSGMWGKFMALNFQLRRATSEFLFQGDSGSNRQWEVYGATEVLENAPWSEQIDRYRFNATDRQIGYFKHHETTKLSTSSIREDWQVNSLYLLPQAPKSFVRLWQLSASLSECTF